MTFLEYLKSKQKILVVILTINCFALFINVFEIEGLIKVKYNYIHILTSESNEKEKHFWPFVKYLSHNEALAGYHEAYSGKEVVFEQYNFYGIFTDYDYSEFIAYISLLFLALFFKWNKYKTEILESKSPNPNFKNDIIPNIWYTLIHFKKNNGSITNGLTIPYLVGAYSLITKSRNKDALIELISNICNANNEQKAVLQYCGDINQFVISLRTTDFCLTNFEQDSALKNSHNIASLYIALSATDFGFTKSEIIDNLWNKYENQISNHKYSWKSLSQSWEPFSDIETEEIHSNLKS